MEKHNILGKKAEASAAFKEKIITFTAWIFILFCTCLVIYFSKIGLKTLFLTSNKHFTLETIDIKSAGLPDGAEGLVNIELLRDSLHLHPGTDNIFDLQLPKIKEQIEGHLCIDSAEVSRQFPGTLKITYTEKRPIARLSSETLIDKNGYVLPDGRRDLILPLIFTTRQYKPGTVIAADIDSTLKNKDPQLAADNKAVLECLNFINFNETFRMSYKKAERFLGHQDFASMEILKVKSVSKHDEALTVMLTGVPEVLLSDNTRLMIPAENVELGIRRACISILHNASANKLTRKIDARYNSTATE